MESWHSGKMFFLIQVGSMATSAVAMLVGARNGVVVMAFVPFIAASIVGLIVAWRK